MAIRKTLRQTDVVNQAELLGLYVEERYKAGKFWTLIWKRNMQARPYKYAPGTRPDSETVGHAIYAVPGGHKELATFLDGFELGRENEAGTGHFAPGYEATESLSPKFPKRRRNKYGQLDPRGKKGEYQITSMEDH